MKIRGDRGFTLIELLVVIAIIGILSSVILASLQQAREKAQIARAKSEVKMFYEALTRYYIDNGAWPACGITSSNLEDLSTGPNGWNSSWKTGYVDRQIEGDPWGTTYYYDGCPALEYECTAGNSSVCSAGPDKAFESFNEEDMVANDDDICIYFPPEC